ncbi:substrate-binding domain-containing protein [Paraburkholderia dinghuensis]|nr:substrate-binding domain-containing protein [Paraburkholderia dinghuensis]
MGDVLTGVGSMATRKLLADLIDQYRRESGCRVSVTSIGGVEAVRRVQDGEPFDFAVLASGALERLAVDGHVAVARIEIVRSGMAVAVAAGAPHPDIGSAAALRDAILGASRIGYSTGPSGEHLLKLIARFGIAQVIGSRIVQTPPGVPVASLIASGEVELGFQQLSELTGAPGIEVVGPLPPDVQLTTVFSAAICSASQRQEAAARFLAFLASEQTDAVKRAHGMEPARGCTPR